MCHSKHQNKQPVGHFIFATLILDSLKKKMGKNLKKFPLNIYIRLQPPVSSQAESSGT